MTSKKKKQIINQALTKLYNSNIIQDKIEGYMYRYRIPNQADIQSDCLQQCFVEIMKYDEDKLVEMILDNPKRLVGLAVTILNSKQIFGLEKRAKKYWTGIAHNILHQSTYNTAYHINTTDMESHENQNINLTATDDFENIEMEYERQQMWNYVREQLDPQEQEILDTHLSVSEPTKDEKKQIKKLLPKLKELITKYNQLN
jgi:hypothetical protein